MYIPIMSDVTENANMKHKLWKHRTHTHTCFCYNVGDIVHKNHQPHSYTWGINPETRGNALKTQISRNLKRQILRLVNQKIKTLEWK